MFSSMDVLQSKKEYLRKLLQEKFFGARRVSGRPRILILGLGVQGGGAGAARFFARLGARVTVTDMKTKKELIKSLKGLESLPIRYVFGRHRKEDIRASDLIVKNPGIPAHSPVLKEAEKQKIPITNDAALFLALAPREKVIGITGTKGKTTLTRLLGHILGRRAFAVGTPGVSFFEYFFVRREPDWIVGEFSSFDLEYVGESPHIAVITSLFADHLNRYRSFAEYARYKMNIARFQKKDDYCIAFDSRQIRKHMPRLQSKIIFAHKKQPRGALTSWRLPPESIMLAHEVARIMRIRDAVFQSRVHNFKVPEGRLEIVMRKKGRIFINDTTATNPGAALRSLQIIRGRFGKHACIAIITGGEDKLFPMDDVRRYARGASVLADHVYLMPGSMTDKFKRFDKKGIVVSSLKEAVEAAGKQKGVVALIPGAASFNMFQNEFHRAEVFIKTLRHMKI